MAIKQIIDDIIAQLRVEMTELAVEEFPDNPRDYKLLHSLGAILVSYNRSNFEEPDGYQYVQQKELMSFQTTLIIRGLHTSSGAYDIIDRIKTALTGFEPTDCTPMYPTNISFIVENAGIWQFAIIFNTTNENYSE